MQKLQESRHRMKGLGVGDIGPIALSVGIAVIMVSVIALILAQFSTGSTNTNFTYVVGKGLTAMTTFADWFLIMVIIVVAVIILSLIMLVRPGNGGT